jgi:hypothetical protein
VFNAYATHCWTMNRAALSCRLSEETVLNDPEHTKASWTSTPVVLACAAVGVSVLGIWDARAWICGLLVSVVAAYFSVPRSRSHALVWVAFSIGILVAAHQARLAVVRLQGVETSEARAANAANAANAADMSWKLQQERDRMHQEMARERVDEQNARFARRMHEARIEREEIRWQILEAREQACARYTKEAAEAAERRTYTAQFDPLQRSLQRYFYDRHRTGSHHIALEMQKDRDRRFGAYPFRTYGGYGGYGFNEAAKAAAVKRDSACRPINESVLDAEVSSRRR